MKEYDKKAYDISMMFAQELLRRMDSTQFIHFVESAPKVRETFDVVYEVLTGSLPDDM